MERVERRIFEGVELERTVVFSDEVSEVELEVKSLELPRHFSFIEGIAQSRVEAVRKTRVNIVAPKCDFGVGYKIKRRWNEIREGKEWQYEIKISFYKKGEVEVLEGEENFTEADKKAIQNYFCEEY